MEQRFRLRGKQIFLTYSQCPLNKSEVAQFLLSRKQPNYVLVARERHNDDNFHLHAVIQYSKSLDISNSRYFDIGHYHPSIEKVKSIDSSIKYVKKDNDYFEEGKLLNKKLNTKEKNDLILTKSLPELVEDGTVSIYNYVQLQRAKHAYTMDKLKVDNINNRQCYWVYGSPGIGKTYSIRNLFPNCYVKSQNKWWDGYSGESVVLLDDFDCKILGHYLKIWADKYSFNAEIKGGSVLPVYNNFFVTSNYLPDQIWSEDVILAQAVTRRFKFLTVINYELVDFYTMDKMSFGNLNK